MDLNQAVWVGVSECEHVSLLYLTLLTHTIQCVYTRTSQHPSEYKQYTRNVCVCVCMCVFVCGMFGPAARISFSSAAQRLADHRDPLSRRSRSSEGAGGLLGVISWSDRSRLRGIMLQCMWFNSSLWKQREINIFLSHFKALAKKIKPSIKPGSEGWRKIKKSDTNP